MKILVCIAFLFFFFTSCHSGENSQPPPQDTTGVHKVIVKEVLETSNYTYLHVSENSADKWLAIPKLQVAPGDTFYYKNGLKMTDFRSKELDRKFDSVFFLQSVSKTPDFAFSDTTANPHQGMDMTPADTSTSLHYTAKVVVKKEDVEVQPANKGVTIAELLSDKAKYEGQTVRISGKVTKFNSRILKRNWIHIQDGTEKDGKFDLTATTEAEVTVGDVIILEGKVVLNKDFGFGYSYDILLEDAKVSKK